MSARTPAVRGSTRTRIRAQRRTQTSLPMTPGHPETGAHDCRRNGAACLMAVLDVATGKVTGRMAGRHRSEEFPPFLDHVAEGTAPGTQVHAILDSVSSHKSVEVGEWLKNSARWTFHSTPTPASRG